MRSNEWKHATAGPALSTKGRWPAHVHRRILTILASAGLSTALAIGTAAAFAPPAHAATPTASKSTTVTVTADPSTLLAFKVPQVIPFKAGADGTLTGPSAASTTLVNQSVFGIHVTKIQVTASNNWTLVSDASTGSTVNQIDFQFGPGTSSDPGIDAAKAAAGLDTSKNAAFNLGYAGSSSDTIELETAGNIGNVTKDLSTEQDVATIVWTVAPGSAS